MISEKFGFISQLPEYIASAKRDFFSQRAHRNARSHSGPSSGQTALVSAQLCTSNADICTALDGSLRIWQDAVQCQTPP